MAWIRNFFVFLFFSLSPVTCVATSLTIGGQPEQVESADAFDVNVSFVGSKSGCGNKSYYLMGLFSKDSGDLFGYTASSSGEWIDRSKSPQQSFMFTASEEGSWSGKLRVKARIDGDGFTTAGIYQFRVDRFTATGTAKAESSNSVSIQLSYVSPPTPTPTPTPSVTPGPTPSPTSTLNPTPNPTTPPLPTPKPIPRLSPKPSQFDATNLIATESFVLTPTPIGSVAGIISPITSPPYAPWLILSGSLLIVGGVIPFGWKMLRDTIDG